MTLPISKFSKLPTPRWLEVPAEEGVSESGSPSSAATEMGLAPAPPGALSPTWGARRGPHWRLLHALPVRLAPVESGEFGANPYPVGLMTVLNDVGPQVEFRIVELPQHDVHLWLHTKVDTPAEEWAAVMTTMAGHLESISAARLARQRLLVLTDGAAPNAHQRKRLFVDVLGGRPVPIAVLTGKLSTVTRGIATAVSWLNPRLGVFEPEEIMKAFDHLGLEHASFRQLWYALSLMKQRLPPNQVMADIATHLGLLRVGTQESPAIRRSA
jgi:hypothetical protein